MYGKPYIICFKYFYGGKIMYQPKSEKNNYKNDNLKLL